MSSSIFGRIEKQKTFHPLFFLVLSVFQKTWRQRTGGGYLVRLAKHLALVLVWYAAGPSSRLIACSYWWFRRVDDVLDGDIPPPPSYSLGAYVAEKDLVVRSFPDMPLIGLEENRLLDIAAREARRLGIDVSIEVQGLWHAMLWELDRRKEPKGAPRLEMVQYAQLIERSIFGLCTKALGIDQARLERVGPELGIFQRFDWAVDADLDLEYGIVNFSQESLVEWCLDPATLVSAAKNKTLWQVPGFRGIYLSELERASADHERIREVLGDDLGGVFDAPLAHQAFKRVVLGRWSGEVSRGRKRAQINS